MNKEVKTDVVESKGESTKEAVIEKKMTKEEYKEKFRKLNLEYPGRIHIDEKYKKPGKVYYIANADLATKQYMEHLGYTLVQRDVEVGSGSLSESSNLGSAVHVQLGITMDQPGVLYEIDKDLYDARIELQVEENEQMLDSKITEAQRPDQKGRRKDLL